MGRFMFSPIVKDIDSGSLSLQINKEICFSIEHLHPVDLDFFNVIARMDDSKFPFVVFPWPNGWRIELRLGPRSKEVIAEADSFSDGFRMMCDLAYQNDCQRIVVSRSIKPTDALPIYDREK